MLKPHYNTDHFQPPSHRSQHTTSVCGLCRHRWPRPSCLHQAGLLLLGLCMPLWRHALTKLDPIIISRPIRTVRIEYARASVWGEGLGNKQHWEGIGAAGGHLEWPIVVAVTSPYTLACLGRGTHVLTTIRPSWALPLGG